MLPAEVWVLKRGEVRTRDVSEEKWRSSEMGVN